MIIQSHTLILIYQHIKNRLGKLMNILLKPSPKILTCRRKIKKLKTKRPGDGSL